MPINYSTTQAFIDNETQDTTVSFADACTLIHMAKNEVARMYVHESILDASILVGYADYSYLNDDEVKLIINWWRETIETQVRNEYESKMVQYKLKCDAELTANKSKQDAATWNQIIETVNNLQYAKVVSNGQTEEASELVQ